jgi:predicted secreted Zn-dependent protease
VLKARELERYRVDLEERGAKVEALVEENARLGEKVRRYKKEARRELRSINDTAVSQLNKTHEENRQMAAQVTQQQAQIAQLQAVIAHYDCQRLKEEK